MRNSVLVCVAILASCVHLAALSPELVELRNRGYAELENEQPANAAEIFRQLIKLAPEDPLGHANLAVADAQTAGVRRSSRFDRPGARDRAEPGSLGGDQGRRSPVERQQRGRSAPPSARRRPRAGRRRAPVRSLPPPDDGLPGAGRSAARRDVGAARGAAPRERSRSHPTGAARPRQWRPIDRLCRIPAPRRADLAGASRVRSSSRRSHRGAERERSHRSEPAGAAARERPQDHADVSRGPARAQHRNPGDAA